MFDDDFDEDDVEDYYDDIPDEAFYYEESAHRYGFEFGYKEAEAGIADESSVENFPYPEDADPVAVEIFKESYLEGIARFNAELDGEDEEWD